jgi:hypothetical protein
MHKSATKCNETLGKWCINKHGASKIIDTFETYHWSIIKNLAENFSNERAVNGFISGLYRSDFIEEMGGIKLKKVSDLMDIANRFADGEDTYNNTRTHTKKRTCSPKDNRSHRYSNS